MPHDELDEQLENLLDKYNLTVLLDSLCLICYEKAEHLRTNWQDEPTAHEWKQDGDTLSKTLIKLVH